MSKVWNQIKGKAICSVLIAPVLDGGVGALISGTFNNIGRDNFQTQYQRLTQPQYIPRYILITNKLASC
ncbi:hypothetical protein J6590_089394 [Homalodisca vitripennis]|nr:hypothetical protein J6590_089394 [Homalodisca vitripennis]